MTGTYKRKTPRLTARERFYSRTRLAESGCLEWTGAAYTQGEGYGSFNLGGKKMRAHRAAWIIETGEVPTSEQHVLHSCDNTLCVNVEHLRVGTTAENSADKETRNRGNHPAGERNGMSKFSDETVEQIHHLHDDGMHHQQIADIVGCSYSWVARVIKGKIRTSPASTPSRVAPLRAAGKLSAAAAAEALRSRGDAIIGEDDFISEDEEWRATPYEGYFVSSFGRVRGRKGRVLKPTLKDTGSGSYLVVACGRNNQQTVHTLVCLAWHGPRPAGMEVAHNDGHHLNNMPDNLRWATRAENMKDKVDFGNASGGSMPGEMHPNAKLTWAQAAEIRSTPDGPRGSLKILAAKYGVSRTTIRYIQQGRNWKDLQAPPSD